RIGSMRSSSSNTRTKRRGRRWQNAFLNLRRVDNMAQQSSLNVLFIGNSFTARNDVPGLIEKLAAARELQLKHRLLSIGGASLRTHWNKGEAAEEIQRGGYDYVVLQEQSTLPIKNATRMHENVRLFHPLIRAA